MTPAPTGRRLALALIALAAVDLGLICSAGAAFSVTLPGELARLLAMPAGLLWALSYCRDAVPLRPLLVPSRRALIAGLGLAAVFAAAHILALADPTRLAAAFPRYPHRPEALDLLQAVLCAGIISPVLEECFFRGVLLRGLLASSHLTTGWAIALSAAAFAFLHDSLQGAAAAAVGGLVLGIVSLRCRSLWPPILAHVVGNLTLIALVRLA